MVTIFHCHPILKAVHIIITGFLFLFIVALLFGKQQSPDSSSVVPFVAVAVYAVAPFAHWAVVSEGGVSSTTLVWLTLPYLQVRVCHPPICKGGTGCGSLPAPPPRETPPTWHSRPLGLLPSALAPAHPIRWLHCHHHLRHHHHQMGASGIIQEVLVDLKIRQTILPPGMLTWYYLAGWLAQERPTVCL